MGNFFGFENVTASLRRRNHDAERRATKDQFDTGLFALAIAETGVD